MARSAQKRRAQRPRPQTAPAKPRKAERPSYEQAMFFPRLRTQAKWMFVFLALVFGVGFVAFGVGSNISGTGIGDILQGAGGGSSGPSVGDARDKVEDNPDDPTARKELADALQANGKRDEAITEYETYLAERPNDVEATRQLAGLYMTRANDFRDEYAVVYAEYQERTGGGLFGPPTDSQFGRALGGKIDSELRTVYTTRLTEMNDKMQAAFGRAATLYSKVAATHPDDEALLQLQVGDAAYQAQRTPLARKAYTRFLKLAPDDPNADYARQQLAVLKPGAGVAQPG